MAEIAEQVGVSRSALNRNEGRPMTDMVIWSEDGLTVSTRPGEDGGFTILGQDLGPTAPGGREYEYAITVAARDVPAVVEALGDTPGADALALVAANAETIVRAGELTWLKGLGVEPRFWSRAE
jgi:hypothetical protein